MPQRYPDTPSNQFIYKSISFYGYIHHKPNLYLVGGMPYPLNNMNVSWDDELPNLWKNKSHVPVTTNQIIYG